jgi:hypothetical protein
MKTNFAKKGTALCASLLVAAFTSAAYASPDEFISAPINVVENTQTSPIQLHSTMSDDLGIYARDLYLAYIEGPNQSTNSLAQRGLLSLAAQAYLRTSVEPAGVVALDIERDDISLFPFIYWPVSEQTPRLSPEARARLQSYTGNGGVIVIDLSGGSTLQSSQTLRTLLDDLQTRPLEGVSEGHVLTQSFYIVDSLPGTATRDVFVERSLEELQGTEMTSFVIGNQNWAGSWSGITVGPDVAEDGIRSGLNMLFGALMGTYKLDELHQPTIDEKREFQEQHEARENLLEQQLREEEAATPPPSP